MLNLNIEGTLGHFGYSKMPEEISDLVIQICTEHAYVTAVANSPYDPEPDGIHIKEDLKYRYLPLLKTGFVWIRSPYALIAEIGSRHRFAHPYMRPAYKAAQKKMRAIIRKSTKEAVTKEKKQSGNSRGA